MTMTRRRGAGWLLCVVATGFALVSLAMSMGAGRDPDAPAVARGGQERSQPAPDASAGGGGAQAIAPVKPVPLWRKAENIAVITIRTGPTGIDSVTASSFKRRLRLAESNRADAIVVEIDTPGGEVGAVLEICQAIKESSIQNTVAWINTQAYSGGAIIALACREIVVARGAKMGDALPIAVGPGGIQALPPAERGKILAPLLTEVLDSARRANTDGYRYDEYLVQSMVTGESELWWIEDDQGTGVAITAGEYTELFGQEPRRGPSLFASVRAGGAPSGVTIYPAPSRQTGGSGLRPTEAQRFMPANEGLENLTRDIEDAFVARATPGSTRPDLSSDSSRWSRVIYLTDGTIPITMTGEQMAELNFAANTRTDGSLAEINSDSEILAWFDGTNLRRLDPLWSEGLVAFMTSPVVRFVILVVFLLGLFIEMLTPGTGVAGMVALLALLMLLVPPMLAGMADWWEIVAIVAGLALLMLEIFVLPGLGIAGIAGLLLLFAGLLFTFVPNQGSGLFPSSPQDQRDLLYGAITIMLAAVTAGVGMWIVSKKFGAIPMLNKLILDDPDPDEGHEQTELSAMKPTIHPAVSVGDIGVALTTLRPVGEAEFGGLVIDAIAENGFIRGGIKIRVCEIRDLSVVVEPAPEAS